MCACKSADAVAPLFVWWRLGLAIAELFGKASTRLLHLLYQYGLSHRLMQPRMKLAPINNAAQSYRAERTAAELCLCAQSRQLLTKMRYMLSAQDRLARLRGRVQPAMVRQACRGNSELSNHLGSSEVICRWLVCQVSSRLII
jgi:hypothetical protein